MIGSSCKKLHITFVPVFGHMLWHHQNEDFVCNRFFEKCPPFKGAVIGDFGSRIWMVWIHRCYTHPESTYILRVVIENPGTEPEQKKQQVNQVEATLSPAQSKAAQWKFSLCEMLGSCAFGPRLSFSSEHWKVKRKEDSILWFGDRGAERTRQNNWVLRNIGVADRMGQ